MASEPNVNREQNAAQERIAGSGSLFVEIAGMRNSNGYLLLALFNAADGFPDNREKAFRKIRIKAEQGTMKLEIKDLPPGTYAFGVVHDENDNQKLDKGLFGIPKEGFCFSRQAMGTAGPPSFDAASVKVGAGITVQQLKIKYW